ncbi:MAG TPA: SDR family oxidoreductase [Burkholderiales bacterium]|nr:SDR family oxidoreductase [Burkholderiales bacterium]
MHTEPRVAIVTGGAGGIGEAAARAITRGGARVAVADLRPAAAEEAAARLRAEALDVEPVTVDVGSEASVRAMVETVLGRWGRIDILVNNAGVESSKPFLEIGVDEYEQVMRVNTTGAWLCCQAVIPTMLRQGSGCIVNVSSVAGQRGGGLLGTAAYSTSKGAVIALTKALAREFAKSGIRVNAVSPSLTMTDFAQRQLDRLTAGTLERVIAMTPIGRVGQAAEIAAVIDFLTSDQASFIAGHVLNVDGGTAM